MFDNGFDEFRLHFVAVAHTRMMLGGQNDGVNGNRFTAFITKRYLALCIRAQEVKCAVAADDRLLLNQAMSVVNGSRHQSRRFIAGITEH